MEVKPVSNIWIDKMNSWISSKPYMVRLEFCDGTGWTWEFKTRAEAEKVRESIRVKCCVKTPWMPDGIKEASGSADIEPTEPHPSGIRY